MFQQATRTIKANNAKNDKDREWNGMEWQHVVISFIHV